jgi:hypothetical protein
VKLYIPTLIWAGLTLLIAIQGWSRRWSSPDISGEATVDLRQHYFAHKSWLFGSLFVSIVFSAAKDFALTGHMIGGTNAGFHVIFGLAAIVAAITRQEWFHKLLAPAVALLFFLYIALLFARL